MIQVLEYRGFIEQSKDSDGYRLTGKLFALGLDQPHVKTLIEISLPVMRQLSRNIGQSCHLAFPFNGQIIVVARMESSEQIGFTVRVGYSQGVAVDGFRSDPVRVPERCRAPAVGAAVPAADEERGHSAIQAPGRRVRLRAFERAPSEFVAE